MKNGCSKLCLDTWELIVIEYPKIIYDSNRKKSDVILLIIIVVVMRQYIGILQCTQFHDTVIHRIIFYRPSFSFTTFVRSSFILQSTFTSLHFSLMPPHNTKAFTTLLTVLHTNLRLNIYFHLVILLARKYTAH